MKTGLKSFDGVLRTDHEISIFGNSKIFWENNIFITLFFKYAHFLKISSAYKRWFPLIYAYFYTYFENMTDFSNTFFS